VIVLQIQENLFGGKKLRGNLRQICKSAPKTALAIPDLYVDGAVDNPDILTNHIDQTKKVVSDSSLTT